MLKKQRTRLVQIQTMCSSSPDQPTCFICIYLCAIINIYISIAAGLSSVAMPGETVQKA
jgi:hypothetical protein